MLSNDVVAVESGEVASKKKAKNERNRLVIVSLKGASVPAVHQGWLRCQMQQTGGWERRYVVLTADELCHASDTACGSKERTALAACRVPVIKTAEKGGTFEFELKSKDSTLLMRADDDATRKVWVQAISESISARAVGETVVFDPSQHQASAQLNHTQELKFDLSVKLEEATTKSAFRKKTVMNDVRLCLTPQAFMICSKEPISDAVASNLTDLQTTSLDGADGPATHRVVTRFTFKRLKTWSLEASGCCKVEVSTAQS
eukprot:COSAG04_NODE_2166_length_4642_cov_1.305745_1_plen_259_part_10